MNWGNKLVLVFIAFAALIGTLVYKAVNTKYELVSSDYYKDELRYQDNIDGAKNANEITKVILAQTADSIRLVFPKELKGNKINGEIWFYCVTDATKDLKLSIAADDEGAQSIDNKKLSKGNYQVKLTWVSEEKKYYSEQDLMVH
ncbi:FixH family protein [Chitinophagaceae bacterium LWZ2-11]